MRGNNIKEGFYKNIFKEKRRSKYKVLVFLTFSYFFFLGNYNLISRDKGTIDISIISSIFSLGTIEKLLLFLVLSFSVSYLFRKKEEEIFVLKNLENKGLNSYLLYKYRDILYICLLPLIINICINTFLYIPYGNIVPFINLILSFLYFGILTIFFINISIFMNLIIKDRLLASLFPVFFIEGIILFFSTSEILISDKLFRLRLYINSLGEGIFNIINIFNINFSLNDFNFKKYILVLLLLTLLSITFMLFSILSIKNIKKENLDKPYFFMGARIFVYIFMCFLVSFILVHGAGYFIVMFNPKITYVEGTFLVNISSLFIALISFVVLEGLYRIKIYRKQERYYKKDILLKKERGIKICEERHLS